MNRPDALLHLDRLTKNFGTFTAVDNVSLRLEEGEIYGFLGPNGAGKTTTIKMLAGLLQPTAGTITIRGRRLDRHPIACKQQTGYIPDRPFLYEKLTGSEYLGFIASLYGAPGALDEAQQYLELFDLTGWQDNLIEGYSHGMRQKLIMTSILMLNQPLLIVDEPMVGLDPKSARILKDLFREKVQAGIGILLSTHSMEIAEELCDRIGIIVRGRLTAEGTIAELRSRAESGVERLEDLFLELTGAHELQGVIRALRPGGAKAGTTGAAGGD